MEPNQRVEPVAINKAETGCKYEQLFDMRYGDKESGMCLADFCLALVDYFFFTLSPLMFGKVLYIYI